MVGGIVRSLEADVAADVDRSLADVALGQEASFSSSSPSSPSAPDSRGSGGATQQQQQQQQQQRLQNGAVASIDSAAAPGGGPLALRRPPAPSSGIGECDNARV